MAEQDPVAPPRSLAADELWNLVPDALLAVDRDGRIIATNAAAGDLFGYPPDELLGMSVENLLPSSAQESHRRQREGYAEDPEQRPMGSRPTLEAQRPSGEIIPVAISLNPVRVESQWLTIAAARDLTDLIAEQQYRALVAQDAATVAARAETNAQHLFAAGIAVNRLTRASVPPELRDMLDEVIGQLDAIITDLSDDGRPISR